MQLLGIGYYIRASRYCRGYAATLDAGIVLMLFVWAACPRRRLPQHRDRAFRLCLFPHPQTMVSDRLCPQAFAIRRYRDYEVRNPIAAGTYVRKANNMGGTQKFHSICMYRPVTKMTVGHLPKLFVVSDPRSLGQVTDHKTVHARV